MAPPVFLIDPAVVPDAQGRVTLEGDEAHHAARVARLRVGESVDLVDGQGRRLHGEVMAVSRDRVDVAIHREDHEPQPSPRIVVVQALAKGDRAEHAVSAMTEVGVDVIVPWSAQHCVATWAGERVEKGPARWRTTARASAKQARRSRLPVISPLHATTDLDSWIRGSALAVCLDESADQPVATLDIPDEGDIVLLVGPEGGISPAERERLASLGAVTGRLGPSVLRTSTAGAVAAAVVLSRTARWGAPA